MCISIVQISKTTWNTTTNMLRVYNQFWTNIEQIDGLHNCFNVLRCHVDLDQW
jgi:hypothetical protein